MEREITETKKSLIAEINKRVEDGVLEPTNAQLLTKLINNADSDTEAISIAALGTTYKRTGFHFDKRIEKISSDIHYFKKNKDLSFFIDENKPVNKLIIGDNYHALQNLLIQYKRKIDIIYIDPPYGKDSMGEFARTNYQNNITRDNLLSMLYPRLQLAKELLSDSGVIFCSIDDKNQAYIKCLFDEVFSERNFIGSFIRKTVSQRAMAKSFNTQHDYCLIYAKDKELFDMVGMEKDFAEYSNPDGDIKGDWKSSDPTMRGSKNNFEIINPVTNKVDMPPIGRGWAFTKEVFEEYLRDGKIIFKTECKNNERGFIYKSYKEDKSVYNLINSLEYSSNEFLNQNSSKEVISIFKESVFDYAKPIFFIESLINHSKKTNSIVLDFFAGSGTTGHAVLELNKKDGGNRKFILCQLNETTDVTPNGIAYDVTSKRLKRIMTGECYDGTKDFKWIEDNEKYGGNLDVYELETVSNKETTAGKSAFEVIDETLYGKEKFSTLKEKIDWVCQNFYRTQTGVENDEQWQKRIKQGK